jgi:hypothetical protein
LICCVYFNHHHYHHHHHYHLSYLIYHICLSMHPTYQSNYLIVYHNNLPIYLSHVSFNVFYHTYLSYCLSYLSTNLSITCIYQCILSHLSRKTLSITINVLSTKLSIIIHVFYHTYLSIYHISFPHSHISGCGRCRRSQEVIFPHPTITYGT